jgi:hypothetical protein
MAAMEAKAAMSFFVATKELILFNAIASTNTIELKMEWAVQDNSKQGPVEKISF